MQLTFAYPVDDTSEISGSGTARDAVPLHQLLNGSLSSSLISVVEHMASRDIPNNNRRLIQEAVIATCISRGVCWRTDQQRAFSKLACWWQVGQSRATTKLLVDGFSTKITHVCQELGVFVSSSSIDLSSRTLRFLTGRLTAMRQDIGTRWRRLPASRQALLALAHLRCGDTCAQPAAGFGIGIVTVYRCIREAVEALSTLAPSPAEAMRTIREKAFVILDGAPLPIDRIAAGTPYHSGKHKRHGMNARVLTGPFGRLPWASPAPPGTAHDLTAARQHGIIEALTEAGLRRWADKAYQGAGGPVRVPFRGRRLKRWKHRHNSSHAKIRCLDEQAMATLKGWRLPRKPRCRTNRVTDVVKAVLVLHHASA